MPFRLLITSQLHLAWRSNSKICFLCTLWLFFDWFGPVVFQPNVQQDQPPQIIHASVDDTPDDEMGDKLPARLEFRESGEDAFFAAVVSEVNGDRVHFKLAPTYTLYMCCRYRTSPAYREELSKLQRGERLAITVQKIANMVRSTVEVPIFVALNLLLLYWIYQDDDSEIVSLYVLPFLCTSASQSKSLFPKLQKSTLGGTNTSPPCIPKG